MDKRLKKCILSVACLFATLANTTAQANIILSDWAFNVDGTYYENFMGDTMPTANTLDANGLGALTFDITGTGNRSFVSFFDYEIDPAINSFFNEFGSVSGISAAGQSWEIDEPGYVFGDIYDNMRAGQLDNTNNVPSGVNDDVSFALGWDFFLNDFESASITLYLTDSLAGLSGNTLYLTQTDPDSNESVYYWSTLSITSSIPEPSSLGLFLVAGLILVPPLIRRRVA